MGGVLTGTRVLDFGRYISAPWCAALLGDLGAEVIRVERRDGADDRWVTPLSSTGDGAMYLQCNRNKQSLALDLTTAEGIEIKNLLVASADIVLVNMPEPGLKLFGLDYESLRSVKPDVILANGTAYGIGGPYSERLGYDGIGQVMSGAIYRSGTPEAPMRAAVPYVDYGTGMALVAGVLAALVHRDRTGEGQLVECSLLATALMFSGSMLMEQAVTGADRIAKGNRGYSGAPSDLYRVKDGWVLVQIVGQAQFKRWCRLMGEEQWLADPRFASDNDRGENGDVLNDRMAEWCITRSQDQVLDELAQARIAGSPLYSPQQALDDAHIRAMGFLKPVDYPGLPVPAPTMETPFRLSATPAEIRLRPPTIGEHTDEILAGLGFDAAAIDRLRAAEIV